MARPRAAAQRQRHRADLMFDFGRGDQGHLGRRGDHRATRPPRRSQARDRRTVGHRAPPRPGACPAGLAPRREDPRDRGRGAFVPASGAALAGTPGGRAARLLPIARHRSPARTAFGIPCWSRGGLVTVHRGRLALAQRRRRSCSASPRLRWGTKAPGRLRSRPLAGSRRRRAVDQIQKRR